jgi:hypothetical protein
MLHAWSLAPLRNVIIFTVSISVAELNVSRMTQVARKRPDNSFTGCEQSKSFRRSEEFLDGQ